MGRGLGGVEEKEAEVGVYCMRKVFKSEFSMGEVYLL